MTTINIEKDTDSSTTVREGQSPFKKIVSDYMEDRLAAGAFFIVIIVI